MSHVFPRHTKSALPTISHGEGAYIFDTDGRQYLDACGGAAASCLGHSNRAVRDAVVAQFDRIPWAHNSFFTSEAAEQLADRIISRAPEGLERVYFVSGGSEAIEAALKLARQYFLERGEKDRHIILARWQSYHGNTLGALATGGNRWRREPFAPLLTPAMHHVSPCHYWRWGEAGETPEAYGARLANELESRIIELGPERVAAFVAEPVVGATLGAVPAVPGYFRAVADVCHRHGILLILDEVMCGMGRTGHLFACEADGVTPDIICVAKGISAGVQPLGATLCTAEIYDTIASGSGFFQHGHTYLAHPTACAAGVAVLDEFERHDLISRVQQVGATLMAALEERFGQHPNVGDIRGRGLFLGLELVADRETKAPFPHQLKLNAKLKSEAMATGLMIYPMGGTIDGQSGDHILLAPPFIITPEQVTEIVDKLDIALERTLPAIPASESPASAA